MKKLNLLLVIVMLFFLSACGMGLKESQQSKDKREKKEKKEHEAAGKKEQKKTYLFERFKKDEKIRLCDFPWTEDQKKELEKTLCKEDYEGRFHVFISQKWNECLNQNTLFFGEGYIGIQEDLEDGKWRYALFYKSIKTGSDVISVAFNEE